MSREPLNIPPDMSLFTVAHEFVSRRVRRFPVVENGFLIGQVSRRDALRAVVKLRHAKIEAHPRYPDYPKGREPIRNYPNE
jgi:CBS domain-containing protein